MKKMHISYWVIGNVIFWRSSFLNLGGSDPLKSYQHLELWKQNKESVYKCRIDFEDISEYNKTLIRA